MITVVHTRQADSPSKGLTTSSLARHFGGARLVRCLLLLAVMTTALLDHAAAQRTRLARADTIMVICEVINQVDDNPLPYCEVQLLRKGKCVAKSWTDTNGMCRMYGLKEGTYSLIITQFRDTMMTYKGLDLDRQTHLTCRVLPPLEDGVDPITYNPYDYLDKFVIRLHPVSIKSRRNFLSAMGLRISSPDDSRLWNISGHMGGSHAASVGMVRGYDYDDHSDGNAPDMRTSLGMTMGRHSIAMTLANASIYTRLPEGYAQLLYDGKRSYRSGPIWERVPELPYIIDTNANKPLYPRILIGVRAGVSLLDLKLSHHRYEVYHQVFEPQLVVGVHAHWKMNARWSLRPEVTFLRRGDYFTCFNVEYWLKANYLDVRLPLVLNLVMDEGLVSPYLMLAPYAGMAVGGCRMGYTANKCTEEVVCKLDDYDVGVVAGLGVDFKINVKDRLILFSIECGYGFGFIEVFSSQKMTAPSFAMDPFYATDVLQERRYNRGWELTARLALPLGRKPRSH